MRKSDNEDEDDDDGDDDDVDEDDEDDDENSPGFTCVSWLRVIVIVLFLVVVSTGRVVNHGSYIAS